LVSYELKEDGEATNVTQRAAAVARAGAGSFVSHSVRPDTWQRPRNDAIEPVSHA
jgi:hypothetical protein